MCFHYFLALIKTKKDVKLSSSLVILAIIATLEAIASSIPGGIISKFMPVPTFPVAISVGVWLETFLFGLFAAWLLTLAAQTLGGKGSYTHGLAAVVYSSLPLTIGVVVATALAFIPFIGPLLAFIAFSTFGIVGFALMFKLLKLLFDIDTITAFVTIALSVLAVVTAGGMIVLSLGLPVSELFSCSIPIPA